MIDATTRVAGTTVQFGDLILMGHTMLNLAVATDLMRHATPAGTLDYAEPSPFLPQLVVADFTAWTGRRPDFEFGRDRLRSFLMESGWRDRVIAPERGAA